MDSVKNSFLLIKLKFLFSLRLLSTTIDLHQALTLCIRAQKYYSLYSESGKERGLNNFKGLGCGIDDVC
jgi:hypothetical protein